MRRFRKKNPARAAGGREIREATVREALVAVLAAVVAFVAMRVAPILGVYEARTLDLRYTFRGAVAPDPHVLIVAIDERTRGAMRHEGRLDEWPRSLHARLLDRLRAGGAIGVGWDVTFSLPSRAAREDETFARSIRQTPDVVLAMYQGISQVGGEGDRTATASAEQRGSLAWLEAHPAPASAIPTAPPENAYGWMLPVPVLRDAAAGIGYVDTPADADGVYRHIRLLRPDSLGQWRFHMVLALFGKLADSPKASPQQQETYSRIIAEPELQRIINFAGPPDTIPRLSYSDVLDGRYRPKDVAGKLVLVGVTGVSEDVRPNPFATTANGIELSANALNSLLQNRFLVRVSPTLELLTGVLLALCGAAIIALLRPGFAFAALLALLAVFLGVGQLLFTRCELVLPVVGPLLACSAAVLGALHFRLSDEETARRLVEAHWASYVGPDVLQEILSNPSLDAAHGVKKDVTIVFSDIRGYSGLSERLTPEEVISLINEHFHEMTMVVFAFGGAVLSCTGDGLLMVFGWPRPLDDHAQRAVEASRMIARDLRSVNERWQAQGKPTIDIGLGIHSGSVVAGRVGGEQGSQITVIGDTVNVAARVQDLNKTFGTRILMTGSTMDRLMRAIPTGKVNRTAIRGREEEVILYEVLHEDAGTAEPEASAAPGLDGVVLTGSQPADAPGSSVAVG